MKYVNISFFSVCNDNDLAVTFILVILVFIAMDQIGYFDYVQRYFDLLSSEVYF